VIVLDSSFLVAYHNRRDVHHGAAAATMEKLVTGEWGPALLLEYVFLEVTTVLLARRGLYVAARLAAILLQPRGGVRTILGGGPRCPGDVPRAAPRPSELHGCRDRHGGAQPAARFVATFDRDFWHVEGVITIPA
jgi:hypothetical protein